MLKTGELTLSHNACEEKYTIIFNLIKVHILKDNKEDKDFEII